MNSARLHAHELLDQLEPRDAAAIERLMESIAKPAGQIMTQAELDASIQAGLDSLTKGQGRSGEAVFDRLEGEIATAEHNLRK